MEPLCVNTRKPNQGMTKLPTFKTSSEQLWQHHCLRPHEVGREDTHTHLSFESKYAQFGVQ
jgi:hypothetical protein